ncbi:LysR family transcriptional regulator [Deinococcus sp. KNUC1210]|uniref:LysR family transcriptional regulator n=1 Tax=Deinococcus sp. KNUC1210 TaxID=2917691 RepID=UPI001EF0063C|nr:LysR family transcriptional regulator [Deinococcus sp. KNUC1210]ULH15084.1 LysR family transcriptional regulator [Deinococcus sp. KNUC1210]
MTRAAERLGIQQPPLSQQIRDLEREVGAALFHRTTRGVELTEAGRAFRKGIEGIPMLVERAVRETQHAARGETGTLRVGFTGAAGIDPAVQQMIRRFRRQFPQVRLTLTEKNTTNLIEDLREHVLDAAFVRATPEHGQEFQVTEVASSRLVAVLPEDHPAVGYDELQVGQLKDDPFILTPRSVGPTLYDTVISVCREAGFEPIAGQTAPQMMSVVSLVAAGLGVSLVPAAMRHLHLQGCTYRDLQGGGPRIVLSLVSHRNERSVVVKNFLTPSRASQTLDLESRG